jgi:hypothetical protein
VARQRTSSWSCSTVAGGAERENSNQLRTARLEVIRAGLFHVDFTETMTGDTFMEQMDRTHATRAADLDYLKAVHVRFQAGD